MRSLHPIILPVFMPAFLAIAEANEQSAQSVAI